MSEINKGTDNYQLSATGREAAAKTIGLPFEVIDTMDSTKLSEYISAGKRKKPNYYPKAMIDGLPIDRNPARTRRKVEQGLTKIGEPRSLVRRLGQKFGVWHK